MLGSRSPRKDGLHGEATLFASPEVSDDSSEVGRVESALAFAQASDSFSDAECVQHSLTRVANARGEAEANSVTCEGDAEDTARMPRTRHQPANAVVIPHPEDQHQVNPRPCAVFHFLELPLVLVFSSIILFYR